MKKYEFMYAFQITRKIIFEVRYSTIGSNSRPDFATSAEEFNQPKTDYDRCGQCQDDILPDGPAKEFYAKWDYCHLHDLNDAQWQEVVEDIETLKQRYNYIEEIQDTFAGGRTGISFSRTKDLSMQPVKK